MKKISFVAVIAMALALLSAWAFSPVRPVSWIPDHDAGLTAEFAANDKLFKNDGALIQRQFLKGVGKGPEDILIGDDGYLYTGYEDGRIVRALLSDILKAYQNASLEDVVYEEFYDTKGRPLGLRFDASGNLIVADAVLGLVSIDKQRNMRVLVDEYQGKKLRFVDHLDIAEDGTIWFSDASAKFNLHDFIYDFIEASSSGRLLSYKPSTGETEVRIDGLFFANGVAVGPDDQFVLVNETGRAKIHRLWLKGDKAGTHDIFIENLPAMPDNLFFKDGIFWVSLITLRDPKVEGLAQNVFLRRIIGSLPKSLLKASSHYGFVVGLTPEAELEHNLQSAQGYQSITTAIKYDDYLFLGSLENSSIAVTQIH
jgi:sugar lactone lactonase YvrE